MLTRDVTLSEKDKSKTLIRYTSLTWDNTIKSDQFSNIIPYEFIHLTILVFSLQILPYFVLDVLNYPGLPGLFVACIASAGLRWMFCNSSEVAVVNSHRESHEGNRKYTRQSSKCTFWMAETSRKGGIYEQALRALLSFSVRNVLDGNLGYLRWG